MKKLSDNINQEVDKKQLAISIWGETHYFIQRSLDVHVTKIKKFVEGSDLSIPRASRGKLMMIDQI